MRERSLMWLSLALLWLFAANATCDHRKGRQELADSYQLARYQLAECQDMGAGRLDPEGFEEAVRLSDEAGEMLARNNWTGADETVVQLRQTVTRLLDRLKNWDPDGDGLSNYAEFMLYGTSWTQSDSDGDGYLDGSEILRYQTDPLDYCGVPMDTEPETPVQQPCPALENLR